MRVLLAGFLVLAAVMPLWAFQPTSWEVHYRFEAQGHLVLATEGQLERIPFQVKNEQSYEQYSFHWHTRPSSLCFYEQCRANLTIAKSSQQLSLPGPRRLVCVQTVQGQVVHYRPEGPLTRQELDLLHLPGHPHAWSLLLEQAPRSWKLHQKWTPKGEALAALLALDAVGQWQVSCQAEKLSPQLKLVLQGTLEGAILGVETQIELKGTVLVDPETQEVVEAELRFQEKRSVGHVGPGLDAQARLHLQRRPLQRPRRLAALVPPKQFVSPSPYTLRLEHREPSWGISFQHDRRWHVVQSDAKQIVLRLIDRGELVAQCNIRPVADPQAKFSLGHWKSAISSALKEHFGQWVEPPRRVKLRENYEALHLVAQGQVQGLPILWHYWIVRHPQGRQVLVLFTLEEKLSERFGNADRLLVYTLRLLPAQPVPEPDQTASDATDTPTRR